MKLEQLGTGLQTKMLQWKMSSVNKNWFVIIKCGRGGEFCTICRSPTFRCIHHPEGAVTCQKYLWTLICQHLFNVKLHQSMFFLIFDRSSFPLVISLGQMNFRNNLIWSFAIIYFPYDYDENAIGWFSRPQLYSVSHFYNSLGIRYIRYSKTADSLSKQIYSNLMLLSTSTRRWPHTLGHLFKSHACALWLASDTVTMAVYLEGVSSWHVFHVYYMA